MEKIFLGKTFIKAILESIELKEKMTSKILLRYLMRAAMSGIIVVFMYVTYMSIIENFKHIGNDEFNLYYLGKFIAAGFFSFALVAIYYTKSELLTSNMMITTIGKYYNKISFYTMFKIMGLCYIGNILGAVFISVLVSLSTIMTEDVVVYLGELISSKEGYIVEKNYVDLFVRSIMCNFYINLSMLMVYSGNIKSDTVKCLSIFFGVFTFAYLGLEHSVANTGLFILAGFYELFNPTVELINFGNASVNVLIALIGNFVGGGILIGLYYGYINDDRKFNK